MIPMAQMAFVTMLSSFLVAAVGLLVFAISEFRRGPRGVPWAKGWLPGLGHLLAMKDDPMGFIESHVEKFSGKPYLIQLMGNVFCILSEDHLKLVQRAKPVELDMDGVVVDEIFANAIASRPGTDSLDMTHVHVLKTKFIPRRNEFIDMFVDVTKRTTEKLTKGQANTLFTNVQDDFSLHVITDAVTSALYGEELAQIEELHDTWIAHSRIIESILRLSIVGMPKFLIARTARKLVPIRAIIDKYFLPEIEKRRAKGESSAKGDYLDSLIWWPTNLSNEVILGFFETIMGAAIMTTRQNLSLAILDIAGRPELQDRIRQEIKKEIDARGSNAITVDIVNHLKLLEATIRESMRLRVNSLMPFRRLLVDMPIEDAGIVPKGTFVAMAASSIHKSEKSFENARTYNPDRWLGTESADTHLSFLSFGAGSHKCPGRLFALGEIKTILATIMLNYKFSGPTLEAKRGDQTKMIPIVFEKILDH